MDIVAVTAGTVVDLPIREGDSVKKGAALATVSSEIATKYGQTRESIAGQLSLQNDALNQERKNLDTLSAETRRGYENQQRLLEQQLEKAERYLRQPRTANPARGCTAKEDADDA